MQASGSALRAQHEWLDAIGRLYRFDASNCQSAPPFGAIGVPDLTMIKAGRSAACQGT
jgi:hypothetical protein